MQYAVLPKLSQAQGRVVCEVESSVPVGTGAEWAGPVTGDVVLSNSGDVIIARGSLAATVILECSRCLVAHEAPLTVEVNEECGLKQIDAPQSDSEDAPEPVPILDGDVVDLTELIRQVLTVNIPPRSLCDPDCAGLCQKCGKSLNLGPCGCEEEADPRWGALRGLAA